VQIPNNGQFAVNAFTGRAYMRTEGGNSVDPARVTLSGDATGTTATATSEAQAGTIATTVGKIQGRTVASTAPTGGQSLTWNSGSSQWEPGGGTAMVGFNRIINGAMVIDQRNAGASVTVNAVSKTYCVDRFCGTGIPTSGVFTLQQTSTAPSGFINSLKATVSTADSSLAATDLYRLMHLVEGFNCFDLKWGTASAKSVTLSFWVYSNLTGTFGGSLINSAVNRSYPFTFAISASNTWEQKSITVAGDTTGTWLTDNGIGISINFGPGVGSTYSSTAGAWAASEYYSATGATNVMASIGNTFYITGVQLEQGTAATSFNARPYGTELALCQRYYTAESFATRNGRDVAAGRVSSVWADLPVTMRAAPTTTQITSNGVGTQTPTSTAQSITITASAIVGDMASLSSYTASAEL